MSWKNLTEDERIELLRRFYFAKHQILDLALETGINPTTLRRYIQRLRQEVERTPLWEELADRKPVDISTPELSITNERPMPEHKELFLLLKKGPISLDALSTRFDRSVESISKMIAEMESSGYVIDRNKNWVSVNTVKAPRVDYKPAQTLADLEGSDLVFGVASDLHAGSTHSQPSAYNRFIQIAYEEYGVRHIFDPGDVTAGVGGYRGQSFDIIDDIRPTDRSSYLNTTNGEIWLADAYTPKLPGLTYYKIGGNHDYWHVVNTGKDAVAALCRLRDDHVYLGYDVADVPLTDRASIRLWHPSGGVPYSLSYRLQKGLEQMAFDELTRAIEESVDPKVRILLAGHLHVEVKLHRGPMVAAHVGCFEGQTNYLKRKGLYPTIGGAIFRVRLTDSGLIQRVEYTFIPFTEVANDWKNFPTPPVPDFDFSPDRVETLFSLARD